MEEIREWKRPPGLATDSKERLSTREKEEGKEESVELGVRTRRRSGGRAELAVPRVWWKGSGEGSGREQEIGTANERPTTLQLI